MRILWMSPWMRPLARVHAEALMARGHDVLLVTTDQHPESDAERPYELVLSGRRKDPRSWAPLPAARRRVAGFAPDVVVTELVRDPRWLLLAPALSRNPQRPVVDVVHDDRPHDEGEQRPAWERALFDRRAARAAATVTFSRYVAGELGGAGERRPHVTVVPLTSDLDPQAVPSPVPASGRRDVVLVGRLRPYKNVAVTLDAWTRHVAGPHWRGDDLVLVGDGDVPDPLPPHVVHRGGAYRYRDVLPLLARAKASVVHYRQASQSGVQVLAMQLGVVPIASPCGGLPEYQPDGEACIGVDDVDGLTHAFDALADPGEAARRGTLAREHYAARLAADVVAVRWEGVLSAAVARAAGQGATP